MSEFIKVVTTGEIKPGKSIIRRIGNKEVAIFNIDGQFHAINNLCPHVGGSLGDGPLDGTIVSCPLHGWTFDVTTGKSPGLGGVEVDCYELIVENGEIFLSL